MYRSDEQEQEEQSPRRQRRDRDYLSGDRDRPAFADPETSKANADLDRAEFERGAKIQEENWIKSYWRPGMGWLYMLICFMDFVVFPALAMFIPGILKNMGVEDVAYVAWTSLTLSNGGLMHLAFGAILGVTAWSRGLEKMRGGRN